jgi:hypothetical protein
MRPAIPPELKLLSQKPTRFQPVQKFFLISRASGVRAAWDDACRLPAAGFSRGDTEK